MDATQPLALDLLNINMYEIVMNTYYCLVQRKRNSSKERSPSNAYTQFSRCPVGTAANSPVPATHSYPAINTLLGTEVYIKDDWTPEKIGE